MQTVASPGAIIVTTPQEVALIDARKAATMFEKVNVPVLGSIENMSYFISPTDGKRYDIFGAAAASGKQNGCVFRCLVKSRSILQREKPATGACQLPRRIEKSPVAAEFMKIARRLTEILSG